MIYPELDINGMTTEERVIEMIKDTIDDGTPSDLDSAKDYLCLLYTSDAADE